MRIRIKSGTGFRSKTLQRAALTHGACAISSVNWKTLSIFRNMIPED
jgi:hypothetical protein